MHSLLSLTMLALAAQAGAPADGSVAAAPATAPASSPAPADDPIGALVDAVRKGDAAAAATPPAPALAAPVPTPPVRMAPAPIAPTAPSAARSPAYPFVSAKPPAEDTDDEEDEAPLPSGPRPYTSLPPTPGGIRPIVALPLVRLRPKPSGSLDGGWVLTRGDGGQALLQFQFNDEGGGSQIEGAWRDMRRSGAMVSSGPVSSVDNDGAGVTIRFTEQGAAQPSVLTLQQQGAGVWTGQLNGAGVTLRRQN